MQPRRAAAFPQDRPNPVLEEFMSSHGPRLKQLSAAVRRTAAAVGAMGLIFAAPAAVAGQDDQLTNTVGGSGGSPYDLTCGHERALVGVAGGAGWYVDRVQLLCVKIAHHGAWVGSPAVVGSAGGSGGAAYSLRCAANSAVSKVEVRHGALVDRITVHCRRLGSGGQLTGTATSIGSAGGSGGTALVNLECGNNRPAKGVRGRSNTAIDALGLRCNLPVTHQLTLSGSVIGGADISGQVQLNRPAPENMTFTMSTGTSHLVGGLQNVQIPAGQSQRAFTATTQPVTTVQSATITAQRLNDSQTTAMGLLPLRVQRVSLSSSRVTAGSSVTATVTLNGNAPQAATATISRSSEISTAPSFLSFTTGSSSQSFTATTSSTATGCASIGAVIGQPSSSNGVSNAQLIVEPPLNRGAAFTLAIPSTISPGQTLRGTVTLSSVALTSVVVTLASSNTQSVTVPRSVTIPERSQSATFDITAQNVLSPTCPVITATTGGQSQGALIMFMPDTGG
jgi:hypothetical protein